MTSLWCLLGVAHVQTLILLIVWGTWWALQRLSPAPTAGIITGRHTCISLVGDSSSLPHSSPLGSAVHTFLDGVTCRQPKPSTFHTATPSPQKHALCPPSWAKRLRPLQLIFLSQQQLWQLLPSRAPDFVFLEFGDASQG